ncbi:MAG: N-6 DNA methylase, partial [Thermomicrobiales bacterium]
MAASGGASLARSRAELVGLSHAPGARTVAGWTDAETGVSAVRAVPLPEMVEATHRAILHGHDPLGESFCRIVPTAERRPLGATYTPPELVEAMVAWVARQGEPDRVVDPGVGSARFLVAAGRRFPRAELVGIDVDPFAALLARGHLAAAGLGSRARVIVGDFRDVTLPRASGRTLFIGNPPYVRHHDIAASWKQWLVATAKRHDLRASQLAGLHTHFFLAIAERAQPGDTGVLITAAEWLDVNYGHVVRELLLGELGVENIQIIEPAAMPFPGTATTAVITGFSAGAEPDAVGARRVAELAKLGALETDQQISRERLKAAARWTLLTRGLPEQREGFVQLGELCRVHRGQVTGANRIWVVNEDEVNLPRSVLYPSVTRARELIAAKDTLVDDTGLRRVIDLPIDLDRFTPEEQQRIEQFLQTAKARGADQGFIARHRKAWWSVGLRDPAPILATYMARRPPVFVRNMAGARHINIA